MWEQIATVVIVAVVLGMDAFSLALGLGIKGVSAQYELKFSAAVALFHVMMPLMGLYLGAAVGSFLGFGAQILGAAILIYIGAQFVVHGYRTTRQQAYPFRKASLTPRLETPDPSGNLLLLVGSVSMDALAVGFGLGAFRMPILFTVLTTGAMAGAMTWLGFLGGRVFSRLAGVYAQMIGGMVLILLAGKLLWK